MFITLVRHGETNYNTRNLIQGHINNPLNETGRLQADKAANYFLDNNIIFDHIGSSPLSRALETAYIIGNLQGYQKDYLINYGLLERNFNELDGFIVEDSFVHIDNPDKSDLDFESDESLIKRVSNTILDIANKYPNESLLFATHSHAVKSLLIFLGLESSFTKSKTTNGEIFFLEVKDNKIKLLNRIIP